MMGRDPRYILPNSLQHVVDVVYQRRFLLCPSEEVNERYLGILGRAQRKYDMTICAVVVMSTHAHLLLRPRDGQHLADFMCFLKSNVAKEIGGRLRGWEGHFFARRYHASTVSSEDLAQVGVLRYVLGHGVKEHLVDRVCDWPGVHCAASLIRGSPMRGLWFDRSHGGGTCEEAVHFAPLPCWEHLDEDAWRSAVEEMVDDIDHQAEVDRRLSGTASLGVTAVLEQDPYERSDSVATKPQPRFRAVAKDVREAMLEAWRQVLAAYYAASLALRSGDRSAVFPEGTFPPALPFVPFTDPGSTVVQARGQPS